jgi:hypothetical protein
MGAVAPYGYIKNPDNKHHLIIDERTAPVIRRIFKLAKSGLGIAKIRQIMTEEKVLRPGAVVFLNSNGNYERFFEEDDNKRYIWTNNSVRGILRNPVYAGHIVGYKRPIPSMKSKKRLSALPEDWVVVKDTHEPIIAPEDWELVQKLITSRRKSEMYTSGYSNVFAGLIKCADCNYAMKSTFDKRRKRPEIMDCVFYQCNRYAVYGTCACTSHSIEARVLHSAVLADINRHAKLAMKDDTKLLQRIENRLSVNTRNEIGTLESELKKANSRLTEIDRLFAQLYEDRLADKISERNYESMSKRYEQEQAQLDMRIADAACQLSKSKEISVNAASFISLVRNYAGIETLTAALLNTLIDKITVSEVQIVEGERVQMIRIYYKFVGCIG